MIIVGTPADDTLVGGEGEDVIDGGAGNDVISGGGGSDHIRGGAGDDVLSGGSGADLFYFRPGDGGDALIDFNPAEGDLLIIEGGWSYATVGTASTKSPWTSTGQGTVTIRNVNLGQVAGSIRLAPPPTAPVIEAGSGNDQISGSSAGERIFGRDGTDVISGGAGNDTIDGGTGLDILSGGAGIDWLTGGAGADLFVFHPGDDGAVIMDFSPAEGDRIWLEGVLSWSLPHDDVTGAIMLSWHEMGGASGFAQILNTTRVEVESSLTVNMFEFVVETVTGDVLGTPLAESFLGTVAGDRIDGGGGDDIIEGFGGDDFLQGGAGDDWLLGGEGDDVLQGGAGTDTLIGGAGRDIFYLRPGGGTDRVTDFDPAADRIDVGQRIVTQIVQQGDDAVVEIEGGARLVLQNVSAHHLGMSNFLQTAQMPMFAVQPGPLVIMGTAAADVLSGGAFDNIIHGGDGDDTITGGRGHDRIDGGVGDDVLVVSGAFSDYRLLMDGDDFVLKGAYGRDWLTGVENIRFGDGRVLELNRMYASGVGGDGGIPEALLSDGSAGQNQPLVLPGVEESGTGGPNGDSEPPGLSEVAEMRPRSALEAARLLQAERMLTLDEHLGLIDHGSRDPAPVAAPSGQAWWTERPLTPTPDVAPTTERFVTTEDYLLPAGQTLHFYSEIELVRPRGWLAITSDEWSPLPTLTTHGRIIVSPGGEEAVATQSGGQASLDINGIVWRNTGEIYSDWVPGNAHNSHARTAYLAANTTVFNDGLIQATASIAAGITGPAFVTLFNGATGVIRAWSDGFGQDSRSLGVVSVRVTNDGLIEASALNGYEARAVTASEVENTGIIRAHAEQSGDAIGIDSAWRIVNSGLIDAAIAIVSWDGGTLENSGQIFGQIYYSTTVTNTGYIGGDIVFHEGETYNPPDNVYDGRGGKLDGVLDMGAGVNRAWLGDDGGIVLVGSGGTSTVTGGAGDDIVDSLGGAVAFDGGEGFDILSFASRTQGLTVDLSDPAAGLKSVEGLIGTAHDDVIRGSSGDDSLWGQAGDDTITGGLGHDFIDGGDGHDVLIVSGAFSDYRLLMNGDDFILKGPDGRDWLTSIESVRFGDGRVLELNRMYRRGVDSGAWADGRIPEALLSEGSEAGGQPLVLPGVEDDWAWSGKGQDGPQILPVLSDDEPLILPGLERYKAGDDEPLVPGVDAAALLFPNIEARLALTGGRVLTLDEQGELAGEPVNPRHDDWM